MNEVKDEDERLLITEVIDAAAPPFTHSADRKSHLYSPHNNLHVRPLNSAFRT